MTDFLVPYGGERLDRIARQMLQTERDGAVEALLVANPGLSGLAVDGVVPAGTVIKPPTAFSPAEAGGFVIPWV